MTLATVRGLLRRARSATLATILRNGDGWPYASLVTVAVDGDARPILLLSDLSDHTRNLKADRRASLLIEAASGRANPQMGPRVSLLGRVERDDGERLRRRFLARHPSASDYANFADFHLYSMTLDRAHFVGGFGKARWIEGRDLLFDAAASAAIADCETSVLAHMNADHVDAIALYATRLAGRCGHGWRMIAIDPEGCDLSRGSSVARLDFPRPVANAAALRAMLAELAADARA